MPVFNAQPYLAWAVESILSQDFEDFEMLIFDDGSNDGSREVLKSYAKRDSRIVLSLGEHRGYSHWLRTGTERAAGKYVARMDADDISVPKRFQQQSAYLDLHPDCVAVGGQSIIIDADGDVLGPYAAPERHECIDARHLRGIGGQIMHPNVMMRTEAVRKVGNYRPEFEPAEDLDLFLRLAEVGRLANLPEVTLKYRVHLKSVSHSRCEQQHNQTSAAVDEAYQRRGKRMDPQSALAKSVPPSEAEVLWSWVRKAYANGYFLTARKYANRAIRRDPWRIQSWRLFVGAALGPWAHPLYKRLKKGARANSQKN